MNKHLLFLLFLLAAAVRAGAQCTVVQNPGNTAQLAAAINYANTCGGTATINLQGDIVLSGALPALTGNAVINGEGFTISGGGNQIFTVGSGGTSGVNSVTIENINLTGGAATGSAGGSSGGGGGLGAGGALDINQANVTLSGVVFSSNTATGGRGGTGGTGAGANGGYGQGGGGGTTSAGVGGYGGGNGDLSGNGGGGAGFGGAVFVSTNSTLNITNGGIDASNAVIAGGSSGPFPGQAAGSGIFLSSGAAVGYTVSAGTSVVAGSIAGDGHDNGLNKFGVGTLVLSGNNAYAGGTQINAGTLQLGSATGLPTGGNVAIAGGATLDLNGYTPTLSLGAVTNAGNVKLGVGTLKASGYSDTGAGTTLTTTINSASSYGQVVTGGAVDLNGGQLDVLFGTSFRPSQGQEYQIITAGGGLNGDFGGIVAGPVLAATATYTSNGMYLTFFLLASYASQAATPNQAATAAALDIARATSNADLQPLVGQLNIMTQAQLQESFTELSPIAYGALPQAGMMISRGVFPDIDRHLAALRDTEIASPVSFYNDDLLAARPGLAPGAGLLAENGELGMKEAMEEDHPEVLDSPWGTFAAFHHANVDIDQFSSSAGLQPGLSAGIVDLTIGTQYRWSANLILGAAASYARTGVNFGDGLGSADVNTLLLGTFGTLYDGGLHLDWYGGGGVSYYAVQRAMPLFGQTANGDPQGKQFDLRVSGGWDVPAGHAILGPTASFEYHYLGIGGFAENGAGPLDLYVGSQSANSFSSSLGGKVARSFKLFGIEVEPSASGAWRHEFISQNETLNAGLDGGQGPSFTVQSTGVGADAIEASGRLDAKLTRSVSAFAEYAGEYGRTHETAEQWGFGAKYKF